MTTQGKQNPNQAASAHNVEEPPNEEILREIALDNGCHLGEQGAERTEEAQTGDGRPMRVEQCVECQGFVSDWVEADEAPTGRICRPCETIRAFRGERTKEAEATHWTRTDEWRLLRWIFKQFDLRSDGLAHDICERIRTLQSRREKEPPERNVRQATERDTARKAIQEILDNALIQRGNDNDPLICYHRKTFIQKLRGVLDALSVEPKAPSAAKQDLGEKETPATATILVPGMAHILDLIELALRANCGGIEPSDTWYGKFCRCDSSAGAVPCEYCAIYNALTKSRHAISVLLAPSAACGSEFPKTPDQQGWMEAFAVFRRQIRQVLFEKGIRTNPGNLDEELIEMVRSLTPAPSVERQPAGESSAPCRHEWFEGRCVHCELSAKAFRAVERQPKPEGEKWEVDCWHEPFCASFARLLQHGRVIIQLPNLHSGDHGQSREILNTIANAHNATLSGDTKRLDWLESHVSWHDPERRAKIIFPCDTTPHITLREAIDAAMGAHQ